MSVLVTWQYVFNYMPRLLRLTARPRAGLAMRVGYPPGRDEKRLRLAKPIPAARRIRGVQGIEVISLQQMQKLPLGFRPRIAVLVEMCTQILETTIAQAQLELRQTQNPNKSSAVLGGATCALAVL